MPAIVALGTPGADSLTISETNYNGPFHVASSNCPTWLTYSATTVNGPTPGPVYVYANNGNQLCHIQVTDNHTGSVDIPVQITTPTPAPTSTPTPTPVPTGTPTPTPVPTATPANTILWQQGASGTLGRYIDANTFQCGGSSGTTINGGPTVNTDGSISFVLGKSGTNCGRDMINPDPLGQGAMYLTDGNWYTWKFHFVDGTESSGSPFMGPDSNPAALIWQIHAENENDTPCTSLNFVWGTYYGGSAAQKWAVGDCTYQIGSDQSIPGTLVSYTASEQDDWTIQVKIAEAPTNGEVIVYRNGVKLADDIAPTYHSACTSGSCTQPVGQQSWWNYGIYKWPWESTTTSLSIVEETSTSMILYAGQVGP